MPAADTRQEFAPPHTPGMLRALVMALVAHAALVAVLAIGVAWKRELPPATVEAELWSAIPQEAAPPPEEPPEPEPEPEPAPKPTPTPPPPVVKPAEPEAPSKADIALAKEKERRIAEEKQKELQAQKAEARKAQEKRELEKQALEKAAKDKQDKARAQLREKEQLEKEKLAKEKAAREAKEKADKAKLADAAKLKAQKAAKEDAKRTEELRQQQIARMTGLAGASGSGAPRSTGTAARSSGHGANYRGRIQAAVKPNITFTDTIVGNPKTEIEVSLSASGEILSKRVIKRSGNKGWDDAAENAIDKTRKLPLDDGKVWSPMIIIISPQTLVGP
ncbi:MAG: cell envelope integrity protein TolA [Rhodoferax sp.]|uniref:cell envelope integrity protein TolA n=1 Tax=Rhodoferax sp. TaxID=50421 RepID=UPI002ACE74CB|nr:cell envelope integrity protein TolA [Rhodoferax sp.]MDZ7892648.1 cell envelope integrity protein TolA [Rhodoferax sp.]